jgi:hypothetical protein
MTGKSPSYPPFSKGEVKVTAPGGMVEFKNILNLSGEKYVKTFGW